MRQIPITCVVIALAVLALSCGPSKAEKEAAEKAAQDAAYQAQLEAVREKEKAPVLTEKDIRVPAEQGLEYVDLVAGTGREAAPGSVVTLDFVGWCDGTKIDSSYDRGQPFTYALGQEVVIPGWNLGIKGMKEGGTRLLIIPPALAYGKEGKPGFVGPDKTLWYRIELKKSVPVY
jgi:FKBP-type peptidyl-prolyl cis-trans isomerase FkpA